MGIITPFFLRKETGKTILNGDIPSFNFLSSVKTWLCPLNELLNIQGKGVPQSARLLFYHLFILLC
jgi:hypothetical protein